MFKDVVTMLYIFNNIKRKEILDSVINIDDDKVKAISNLINFGIEEGLDGNLWKKYIIYTFIFNDNSYTRAIERNKNDIGYSSYVDSDFHYFYELYNRDILSLGEACNFKITSDRANKYLGELIDEIISKIIDNDYDSFKNAILDFYKNKGLSYMAIYKAFRVDDGKLKPITNVLNVTFDDLIGYDMQKELLCDNTECSYPAPAVSLCKRAVQNKFPFSGFGYHLSFCSRPAYSLCRGRKAA